MLPGAVPASLTGHNHDQLSARGTSQGQGRRLLQGLLPEAVHRQPASGVLPAVPERRGRESRRCSQETRHSPQRASQRSDGCRSQGDGVPEHLVVQQYRGLTGSRSGSPTLPLKEAKMQCWVLGKARTDRPQEVTVPEDTDLSLGGALVKVTLNGATVTAMVGGWSNSGSGNETSYALFLTRDKAMVGRAVLHGP